LKNHRISNLKITGFQILKLPNFEFENLLNFKISNVEFEKNAEFQIWKITEFSNLKNRQQQQQPSLLVPSKLG
jgi:hypothetical protein